MAQVMAPEAQATKTDSKKEYPQATHFIVRWGEKGKRLAEVLCPQSHLSDLTSNGWPDGHTVQARYVDDNEIVSLGWRQILLIADLDTASRICGN